MLQQMPSPIGSVGGVGGVGEVGGVFPPQLTPQQLAMLSLPPVQQIHLVRAYMFYVILSIDFELI